MSASDTGNLTRLFIFSKEAPGLVAPAHPEIRSSRQATVSGTTEKGVMSWPNFCKSSTVPARSRGTPRGEGD